MPFPLARFCSGMHSNQCACKCSDKYHPAHARAVVGDTDPYLADSTNQYTFNLDCFETEEFLVSVSPNDQRLHGVRCFDNSRNTYFFIGFRVNRKFHNRPSPCRPSFVEYFCLRIYLSSIIRNSRRNRRHQRLYTNYVLL